MIVPRPWTEALVTSSEITSERSPRRVGLTLWARNRLAAARARLAADESGGRVSIRSATIVVPFPCGRSADAVRPSLLEHVRKLAPHGGALASMNENETRAGCTLEASCDR